jgi:lysozyme family protein
MPAVQKEEKREMSAEFDRAFAFVVGEEGYKSNLKGDPGGLTIFGISGRWYPDLVAKMMKAPRDVALGMAKAKYAEVYWAPVGCDKLPWPDCMVLFDTAVNDGAGRAKRFKADTWRQTLCNRTNWQLYESKSDYEVGLLDRIYDVFEEAKKTGGA